MSRVFISRKIPTTGIDLLKKEGHEVDVWQEERPMTKKELMEATAKAEALICMNGEKIDKEFLEASSHLKVIALYSVGFDSMDVETATRLGIPMGNTPDVLSNATADVAFTLLLNVSRKAFFHHRRILNGEWDFFRPTTNLGIELPGKTLGIFGLGRIGEVMAKRCQGAFDMNIIYHNRNRNKEAEKKFNARYVSFDELLEQSDVLSVHTALTEETRGRFNKETFAKMKPTSIFINTGRGSMHNQQDLYDALVNKTIWGAGLDVTNPEPMDKNEPLLFLPNVAVLPHIGSATEEARSNMSIRAAENVIAALKGENLPYPVNPEVNANRES